MINVGVVAASMAMRVGLREVINSLPEMTTFETAARIEDLPENGLDVLVIVLPAGLGSGSSTCAVLYLTDESAALLDLPRQGGPAWGALPVDVSEGELQAGIRALAEGLWVGAPALVGQLMVRKPVLESDEADSPFQVLTARESEVLQLTAEGLANKQIALRLGISEHTIKFHLSSLYAKLGVSSRTEAIRVGVRRGLVVL